MRITTLEAAVKTASVKADAKHAEIHFCKNIQIDEVNKAAIIILDLNEIKIILELVGRMI